MWIRSQNRKILTNVNEVLICAMDDNKYFIEGFWDKGSDTLGIYSSEEKALNVLDDIQTHLKFERRFISNTGGGDYWLDKGATVYQMLQDEDVKL